MTVRGCKDLNVWKKSIDLVDFVYDVTEKFPSNQNYRLVDQLQRCAVSVPSNIAEGSERHTTKEYIQFLYISKGSLAELETQLMIALRRKYISEKQMQEFSTQINDVDKMLFGLIKNLKEKI